MENSNITLCMMVKDEEAFLDHCLRDLSGVCDDIIIVDTGSKDKTKEIALSYTKNVDSIEFTGNFSEARNIILKRVKTPWILFLDADEFFNQKDIPKLVEMVKEAPSNIYAFNFYRYNFFSTGGWNTSKLTIRLFRNMPEIVYEGRVMESTFNNILRAGGKICRSPIVLNHLGLCRPYKDRKKKHERYIQLLKEELLDNPDRLYLQGYIALNQRCIGHIYEALDNIESALSIQPETYISSALLYYIYGHVLRAVGNNNKALEAYVRSTEIDTNDPLVWNMIGVMSISCGDYERAESALDKAIEQEPILIHVLINKGLLAQAKGYYKQAVELFERVSTQNPQFLINKWNESTDYDPYCASQYETIMNYPGLEYTLNYCRNKCSTL